MVLKFFILLSLAIGTAAAAQQNQRAPPQPQQQSTGRRLDAQDALRATNEQALILSRRNEVLEAKAELLAASSSRLEVIGGLLGATIGLFALIATILLVIIAWRTPSQAIAAAVKAVDDEIGRARDNIESQLAEAQRLVESIKTHETTAISIIASLRLGETPKSQEDRDTVEVAAAAAASKPPRLRSADDFRTVITNHNIKQDWTALRDDASAMEYFHPELDQNLSFAMFFEALALGELRQHQESVNKYALLIDKFGNSHSYEVRKNVLAAIYNKGCNLVRLDKRREGINEFDKIIEISKVSDPALSSHILISAHYNKACASAQLGRIRETIRALEEWSSNAGGVNCEKIANDKDFDLIRSRPAIRAFLRRHGCS